MFEVFFGVLFSVNKLNKLGMNIIIIISNSITSKCIL